jgi:hypothetical protein
LQLYEGIGLGVRPEDGAERRRLFRPLDERSATNLAHGSSSDVRNDRPIGVKAAHGRNHNMKIHRDIFDVCDWEQITPEQAQAYGYGSYFAALGMAETGEDLFGEVPEFYLH